MKFLFVAQTNTHFNVKCNRYFLKISNNIILKVFTYNHMKFPKYYDESTLSLTKNKYLIASRNKSFSLYKYFEYNHALDSNSKCLNKLIKTIKMDIFK